MNKNEIEITEAIINIGRLCKKIDELRSITFMDDSTKNKMMDFRQTVIDNLKVIQLIKSKDNEDEITTKVEEESTLKEFVFNLILKTSKTNLKKQDYKAKINEKQKIRIALAGETSAGKTIFCNSIFSTNIFFVTQEEATGAAVEIESDDRSRVEVYDKNDKIIDSLKIPIKWFCEDKKNLADKSREKVKEFIKKYTRVGSEELNRVSKVKVFMPLQQLPKNIILIDTPGFNANSTRSEIARKVISESQACIFIIDARNALKSKEFQVLESIREEVGKTFIILNKMDLVMADDDLDCDGEDTEAQIIDRVKSDLQKRLGTNNIILYPVCSLNNNLKAEKAKIYVDNLHRFVEEMLTEIVSKRIEFLIDTYAKESIAISNSVINIAKATINTMEKKKNQLQESKPKDFDVCIDDIWNKVYGNYKIYIYYYKKYMINYIDIKLNEATAAYLQWINSASKSDIKNIANYNAKSYINKVFAIVNNERLKKLKEVSSRIINDIVVIIQELYDDLPFKVNFNPDKLAELTSATVIRNDSSVENAVNSINSGMGTAAKGAIFGAVVFGPVGGLVGGVLGGLLGDSLKTAREKVYNAFVSSVSQIRTQIMADYNNDTEIDNDNSFASKLRNILIGELNDYVEFINDKIKETEDSINLVTIELQTIDSNSKEVNDIVLALNDWRNKRRNAVLTDKYVAKNEICTKYYVVKNERKIIDLISNLTKELESNRNSLNSESSNTVNLTEHTTEKIFSSKYKVNLNNYKKVVVVVLILMVIDIVGIYGIHGGYIKSNKNISTEYESTSSKETNEAEHTSANESNETATTNNEIPRDENKNSSPFIFNMNDEKGQTFSISIYSGDGTITKSEMSGAAQEGDKLWNGSFNITYAGSKDNNAITEKLINYLNQNEDSTFSFNLNRKQVYVQKNINPSMPDFLLVGQYGTSMLSSIQVYYIINNKLTPITFISNQKTNKYIYTCGLSGFFFKQTKENEFETSTYDNSQNFCYFINTWSFDKYAGEFKETSVRQMSAEDYSNYARQDVAYKESNPDSLDEKEFLMSGAINNKLNIHMKLNFNKKEVIGTYYYDDYKTDIKLKGVYDNDNNIIVNELDNNGEIMGVFNGKISTSEEFRGIWSNLDGTEKAPFTINLNNQAKGDVSSTSSVAEDFIFPDSNRVILTENEVVGLPKEKLEIARNEIYARHGYVFSTEPYYEYFRSKSWYTPNPSFKGTDRELNEIEIYNIKLIKNTEAAN